MTYSISELAKISRVTTRTLRHYHDMGLLLPSAVERNGYRTYGEAELHRLQQILFFRALDVPLIEIKRLLDRPDHDRLRTLKEQRRQLEARKEHVEEILQTINKTIRAMEQQEPMTDEELYEGFSPEEITSMKEEVEERWGETDAYKESQRRVAGFTRDDWKGIKEESDAVLKHLVELMDAGKTPDASEVQAEVAKHYAGINRFYDVTPEIYLGLAEMYLADPRFRAHYAAYHPALPEFLAEGMRVFVSGV